MLNKKYRKGRKATDKDEEESEEESEREMHLHKERKNIGCT